MKKQTKKLVLSKETVRRLEKLHLETVVGGSDNTCVQSNCVYEHAQLCPVSAWGC